MKKYEKKEMLETVAMLKKVNEIVTKSCTKNIGVNIGDVLSGYQERAITLGNRLETMGEISKPLVHLLEEYCETIYQLSIGFSDKYQCKKLSGKVLKQLTALSNGIRYDLPDDKKEIVFFPYKASMWVSLESIWKAASEDKACQTYVVPIPYFDKNQDGTLGQMHYEGSQYPDYVPITSWEDYDLKEHRPDVAYIHNPYDGCNYVTSIHPMFYAKVLKKYVDKLVYIPYFTAVNDKVEPHFCVLPGTLYADRVVVQSEIVRQTYIDEIHKFEKENHSKDVFGNVERKVLALGSPACDKVRASANRDMDIPEEWKNIVYRSDGTRKKIVLYNTSVQNILTYSGKMMQKITDSLQIFQRYQKEIALLWRPHPLIPATLQSMRSDLWNEYREIVFRYRASGWGIYDDSADMNCAVAVSDAYYGDGGSLLALFKETGKTIMLQTIL